MDTMTHQHHARRTANALDVDALSKSYDGRTVVDDVSFSVGEGEIFAILGPYGAGKTASSTASTWSSASGSRPRRRSRMAGSSASPR